MIENNLKRCTICNEFKSLDHFRKDKSRADGFHPWCKECQRLKRKIARNTDGNAFREGEKRRHKEYALRKRGLLQEEKSPSQKASENLKKYYDDPSIIQKKRDYAFEYAIKLQLKNKGGHKYKGDDGIWYRSQFEVLFARFLNENNIPYKYEVPLKLCDGSVKIVDFVLWENEIFVEVSGYGHKSWRDSFDRKMKVFRESYENPILVVVYNDTVLEEIGNRFWNLSITIDISLCSFSNKKRLKEGIYWLKNIYRFNFKNYNYANS